MLRQYLMIRHGKYQVDDPVSVKTLNRQVKQNDIASSASLIARCRTGKLAGSLSTSVQDTYLAQELQ